MSEMDEIYKEQAEAVHNIREERAEEISEAAERAAEEELMAYAEKSLSETLAEYNDDDVYYVVDKACIQCNKATEGVVCLEIGKGGKTRLGCVSDAGWRDFVERDTIDSEKGMNNHIFFGLKNEQTTKKLFALHSTESSVMGDTFATVIDRTYLREYDDHEKEKESEEEPYASIVSCGNCGIFRLSDIDEIEKRMDKSKEYGTCYSLIKTMEEWTNPLCMERVAGECDNSVSNTIYTGGNVKTVCIRTEHHKPMTFDTDLGEKEGLTMLSTLLCVRGGVITITTHGQKIYKNYYNMEDGIQKLMDSIEGKPVSSFDEIRDLSTVEILARLIYQEERNANNKGQNAVMFSVINRLFSQKGISKRTNSNHLYSIITASSQYSSLTMDSNGTPNSYRPPISEEDLLGEKEAWENAKRLAAIAFIAVGEYGNKNKGKLEEKDRREKVVKSGDMETYKQIVDFIEQQEDINGEPIVNEIDTRESFRGHDYYKDQGYGPIDKGGNTFFWEN